MAIEDLMKAGDDALANQFLMILPPFPGQVDLIYTTVRVLTFDIPDSAIGTYEVFYGSQKATKPSGMIDTANEFTFTFRNDKNWNVYGGFYNWKQFIANEDTGVTATDMTPGGTSSIRIPIIISSVDGSGAPSGLERVFEGCWISTLAGVGFDRGSGDPIETSVTMNFIKMRNPA